MSLFGRHLLLSATLLISSSALVALSDDEVTLSLRIDQSIDGVAAIDIDETFRVVLSNNSDKEVHIWHPFSRNGYYCLQFESKNLATGETFSTIKRRIADDAYFQALEERGSQLITIQPHATFTTYVELIDYAWGEPAWLGVPEPNTGDQYLMKAQYQSALKSSDGPLAWTGSITSAPTKVRIVSKRINTPHEYLWNGFPNLALRVMRHDPAWINRRDEEQQTPLHVAARFKHVGVVTWLLENGADVNPIAYGGSTPLHLTSDPDVVKEILKYDPDLSIAGQSLLQSAAANFSQSHSAEVTKRWKSIVDFYLAAGVKYDLLTAIELDDLDRVKAVLSDASKSDDAFYFNRRLRRAASLGRLAICRFLIEECGDDVDQFDQGSGYPILKDALAHPEVVKLLIDSGADLERRITWQGSRTGFWIIGDDATVLHHAASDGVPETIQVLLDAGVDPFIATQEPFGGEASNQTALDVAAFVGNGDNAEAIVNHPRFQEADAARRHALLDRCLLRTASSSSLVREDQRPKLLTILLKSGADPNAVNAKGHTAVQVAASKIYPGADEVPLLLIKILRDHGATLDLFSTVAIGDQTALAKLLRQRDPQSIAWHGPDGYPAFHLAVAMDYEKVVMQLLEAGADVNCRNGCESTWPGGTPLHEAAFWGRAEIAALLIKAGADVNARGEARSTPLHFAAELIDTRIARLLLNSGAAIDAKDEDHKTPLDWCRDLKSINTDEIERLFQEQQER